MAGGILKGLQSPDLTVQLPGAWAEEKIRIVGTSFKEQLVGFGITIQDLAPLVFSKIMSRTAWEPSPFSIRPRSFEKYRDILVKEFPKGRLRFIWPVKRFDELNPEPIRMFISFENYGTITFNPRKTLHSRIIFHTVLCFSKKVIKGLESKKRPLHQHIGAMNS
tara:strand:- start:2041 stop:2532 length:492 start_codon:yes stop_codon:yes gene_type:complete